MTNIPDDDPMNSPLGDSGITDAIITGALDDDPTDSFSDLLNLNPNEGVPFGKDVFDENGSTVKDFFSDDVAPDAVHEGALTLMNSDGGVSELDAEMEKIVSSDVEKLSASPSSAVGAAAFGATRKEEASPVPVTNVASSSAKKRQLDEFTHHRSTDKSGEGAAESLSLPQRRVGRRHSIHTSTPHFDDPFSGSSEEEESDVDPFAESPMECPSSARQQEVVADQLRHPGAPSPFSSPLGAHKSPIRMLRRASMGPGTSSAVSNNVDTDALNEGMANATLLEPFDLALSPTPLPPSHHHSKQHRQAPAPLFAGAPLSPKSAKNLADLQHLGTTIATHATAPQQGQPQTMFPGPPPLHQPSGPARQPPRRRSSMPNPIVESPFLGCYAGAGPMKPNPFENTSFVNSGFPQQQQIPQQQQMPQMHGMGIAPSPGGLAIPVMPTSGGPNALENASSEELQRMLQQQQLSLEALLSLQQAMAKGPPMQTGSGNAASAAMVPPQGVTPLQQALPQSPQTQPQPPPQQKTPQQPQHQPQQPSQQPQKFDPNRPVDPTQPINPEQMMERLKTLMSQTAKTQFALQDWDKKHGLPKSHSQTMVKSARSRKQLQDGIILKKWDGSPLIDLEADKSGKGDKSSKSKEKSSKAGSGGTGSRRKGKMGRRRSDPGSFLGRKPMSRRNSSSGGSGNGNGTTAAGGDAGIAISSPVVAAPVSPTGSTAKGISAA